MAQGKSRPGEGRARPATGPRIAIGFGAVGSALVTWLPWPLCNWAARPFHWVCDALHMGAGFRVIERTTEHDGEIDPD